MLEALSDNIPLIATVLAIAVLFGNLKLIEISCIKAGAPEEITVMCLVDLMLSTIIALAVLYFNNSVPIGIVIVSWAYELVNIIFTAVVFKIRR